MPKKHPSVIHHCGIRSGGTIKHTENSEHGGNDGDVACPHGNEQKKSEVDEKVRQSQGSAFNDLEDHSR
jgi:hypothetical protein